MLVAVVFNVAVDARSNGEGSAQNGPPPIAFVVSYVPKDPSNPARGVLVVRPPPGRMLIGRTHDDLTVEVRLPGEQPQVLTHMNFQPKGPADERYVFRLPESFSSARIPCGPSQPTTQVVVSEAGETVTRSFAICPGVPLNPELAFPAGLSGLLAPFSNSGVPENMMDTNQHDTHSQSEGLPPLARDCLRDLEAIPAFLLANDAGMQQHPTPAETDRRHAALQTARGAAQTLRDEARCVAVLQAYLAAWRRGHLFVQSVGVNNGMLGPSGAYLPSIELLSPATALVTLPSFFSAAHAPLQELLDRHYEELEARANWIIDVRGNGGGSDFTYAPLLPWLMPDGWIDVSDRVFVTATNLQAEERIAGEVAPGDAETVAEILKRMRSAPTGSWVQQQYDSGWQYQRPERALPRRPQRVAVLIDGRCGSSCEQFLLTVRQSFSVKLVGHRPSFGGLDASNLRPHLLPSGRHRLWYATTVSNRIPALPIDGIGVQPDVLLPYQEDRTAPMADVIRTQRWLEGDGWSYGAGDRVQPPNR